MKRFLLLTMLMPLMALADTQYANGRTWTYTITGSAATVTGVNPSAGDLIIPGYLGGSPVRIVAYKYSTDSFSGKKDIESVVFPASLTRVDDTAFQDCSNLERVSFPEGLKTIGKKAFYGCKKLTEVFFPEGMESIGSSAFGDGGDIRGVSLPLNATYGSDFYSSTFSGNIQSLYLPSPSAQYAWVTMSEIIGQGTTLKDIYTGASHLDYWNFWHLESTFFTLHAPCKDATSTSYYDFEYWEPTFYTTFFNANGGSVYQTSKSYPAGIPYGALPVPWKEGYKFDGWYTSSSGGSKVTGSSNASYYSRTFYAHWSKPSVPVTVTFNANGGTGTMAAQTFMTGVSQALNANKFKRTGYMFEGWALWSGDSWPEYYDGEYITVSGSTTLYAVWTKEPTYYSFGGYKWYYEIEDGAARIFGVRPEPTGAVSLPSSISGYAVKWLDYGPCEPGRSPGIIFSGGVTSFTLPSSLEYLDKGNFSDSRWFLNQGSLAICDDWLIGVKSSGSSLTIPLGVKKIAVNSVAAWDYGEPLLKTLSLPEGLEHICSQAFCSQDQLTNVHIPASVKTIGAYAFDGSSGPFYFHGNRPLITKCNGGYGDDDGGAFGGWNADVVVYFKRGMSGWRDGEFWAGATTRYWPTAKIAFNANGGSCGTSSKDYELDSPYGSLPTPTRTGASFAGWYTSSSGGTRIYDSSIVSGTRTLYAHWSMESYSISFNANGGSCSETSRPREYGSSLGSLPTPSRTGYSFAGWFTSSSGGSQVSSSTTVFGNMTYYAHWTANVYTLTFNANGGSVSPASQSVTYDSTYGSLPTPSKDHSRFLGWFTTSSGGTQISSSTRVAGNATVYAHWETQKYTLTFNANGGSCSKSSSSVAYGEAYGTLPTPARTGYTFAGWYTSSSGGSRIYTSTTMTAEGATVYAHWTANPYSVKFDGSGGSGSMAAVSATYDSSFMMPASGFFRNGYRFLGWADSRGGSVKYSAGGSVLNLSSSSGSTVTLYAVWAPAVVKINYFRQRYPWNGLVDIEVELEGDENVDYRLMVEAVDGDQRSVRIDTIGFAGSDVASKPILMRNGKSHLIWNSAADLPAGYQCDSVRLRAFFATADMPYPAESGLPDSEWSAQGMLDLCADEVRRVGDPLEISYGASWFDGGKSVSMKIDGRPFASRSGDGTLDWSGTEAREYVFEHRVLDASGNPVGETYSAKLRWITRSQITFDANLKGLKNLVMSYDNDFAYGQLPELSAVGYDFAGWWTGPVGGRRVVATDVVSSNVCLFAHWLPHHYTVVFNANGGEGTMTSQPFTYGEIQPLSTNKFVRPNYVFMGWSTSLDGSRIYEDGQTVENLAATDGAIVALYAVWRPSIVPGVPVELDIGLIGYTPSGLPSGLKYDKTTGKVTGAAAKPTGTAGTTVVFKKSGSPDKTVIFEVGPLPVLRISTVGTGTGKVSGAGAYVANKKTTLKATADAKDDVAKGKKKSAFAGWYADADCQVPLTVSVDHRKTSISFVTGIEDRTVYAKFVTTSEDEAMLSVANIAPGTEFTVNAQWTKVVEINSHSLPTVTVKGLPAGLKFDAKSLTISGKPTKPGKYTVDLLLKNTSVKTAKAHSFTIIVPNLESGLVAGGIEYASDAYTYVAGKAVGPILPVFAEGCKVTASGLPSGLKLNLRKDGTYAIEGMSMAKPGAYTVYLNIVQGKTKDVATITVNIENRSLSLAIADGNGLVTRDCKVVGNGSYAAGKKVTLKATAAKNAVFAGWYRNAGCTQPLEGTIDYRMPSFVYVTKAVDETIWAKFVPTEEDRDMRLVIDGTEITANPDDACYETSGAFDPTFNIVSVTVPKAVVNGLPAGLKFDTKLNRITGVATKPGVYTVTVKLTNTTVKKAVEKKFTIAIDNLTAANRFFRDPILNGRGEKYEMSVGVTEFDLPTLRLNGTELLKVSGLPSGLKYESGTGKITGIATKAGTYTVYLTVGKAVSTFTVGVKPLPEWVMGTFEGYGYAKDRSDVRRIVATVSKNGKISAKWYLAGDVVETKSVNALLTRVNELSYICECEDNEKGKGMLVITPVDVEGKIVGSMSGEWFNTNSENRVEEHELFAMQNIWKAAARTILAPTFANGTMTSVDLSGWAEGDEHDGTSLPEGCRLDLKYGKNGAVTTAFYEPGASKPVSTSSATLMLIDYDARNGIFHSMLVPVFNRKNRHSIGLVLFLDLNVSQQPIYGDDAVINGYLLECNE